MHTYVAYLLTIAVFFAHPPGPSQLLFMAHAVRHGVRPATATMAGDLSANTLQIIATGFGIAGLIVASAQALTVVKWAGVAYLAWVGMRTLLTAPATAGPATVPRLGRSLFRQGFITSAANPYAVVFFAALFPQFINPHASLSPQIAVLGVTYLVVDGTILVLLGISARRVFKALGSRAAGWMNRICGGLMIIAALLLSQKEVTSPGNLK
jgi:threonine/homoserine/homoserine lactone efflux protein